jgi:tRNA(Ile)-lysidine synthetase-like protein
VRGGEIEVRYGEVIWRAAEAPEPVRAQVVIEELAAPPGPAAVAFDLDRLALPLRVRAPRPGDRMRPRGGRGTRKLSDLLIDAKVPRVLRSGLSLLEAADGTILFVPGLRPSEVGRPGPTTKRWIQVTVR